MLLEIDDWRLVGDLQYRFNKCFPYLALQVFDPKKDMESRPPENGHVQLKEIRRQHQSGVLTIKSWYTREEVEKNLKDQYGISARIVQVVGGKTIADPGAGKLSLDELSRRAEAAEKAMYPPATVAEEIWDEIY